MQQHESKQNEGGEANKQLHGLLIKLNGDTADLGADVPADGISSAFPALANTALDTMAPKLLSRHTSLQGSSNL